MTSRLLERMPPLHIRGGAESHGQREWRVLLLLPNLRSGGSQEAVRTLASHLAISGCRPVVCALFEGGPLHEDFTRQGTPVHVLNLPRRPFRALPWYLSDMRRILGCLSEIIERYQIEVMQPYVLGTQEFLVLALARAKRVPLTILNFRNENFLPSPRRGSWRNRLRRNAYWWARRWADDYVAVADETKRAMLRELGLRAQDVTTVCNGVDVQRYETPIPRDELRRQLGFDAEDRLVITVGTLKIQKGHRHLINAAAEVLSSFPDVHFLFVGAGALRAELEEHVRAGGQSEHFHFLGDRRDVPELLAASDLFVLPSLWEGMSMALLEAMAAAIPIVATDVSGTAELIRDKVTGRLVGPGDEQALAKAIGDILGMPAPAARALGEAARQVVVHDYSAARQAAQYIALYERLLRRKLGDRT